LPDELIIIDQSDNDESKQSILSIYKKIERKELELKYVLDNSIAGLVPAKAYAVTIAHGDIIMFIEDDVILESDYVKNMLMPFDENPELMGTCGVITEVDASTGFYRSMFRIFHRGIFYDKRVHIHGNLDVNHKDLIKSNYLSGGVSAFRREVFDKVKFDTKNEFHMLEDIDFSTRAVSEFGEDNFFINTTARLQHLMSPVNRARQAPRYSRKLREFFVFYKKNRYEQFAFISLLWLLVGLLLEAVYVSIRSLHFGPIIGTFSGIVKGIRWKLR
jgi:GT2 family glycosyltransferase